jgi:hypothetical protein
MRALRKLAVPPITPQEYGAAPPQKNLFHLTCPVEAERRAPSISSGFPDCCRRRLAPQLAFGQ